MVRVGCLKFTSILFAGLIANSFVLGQDNQNSVALAKKVVVLSGADNLIEIYDNALKQGFDREASLIPESKLVPIRRFLKNAFSVRAVRPVIEQSVLAALSDENLKTLFAFYSSAIGEKISKLELEGVRPEAAKRLQHFMATLELNPVSDERTETILQLESAKKAAETSIAAFREGRLAIVKGLLSVLPEKNKSWSELESEITQRVQLEMKASKALEKTKQGILVHDLFIYQTLSEFELRKYTQFLKTREAQLLNDSIARGLRDALSQISDRLSELTAGKTPKKKNH